MKKVVYVLIAALWLASIAGTYLLTARHFHPKPVPLANNTLRWVRDVSGVYQYGWYEDDGSAFNSVAHVEKNHRFAAAGAAEPPKDVPVYIWQRVN